MKTRHNARTDPEDKVTHCHQQRPTRSDSTAGQDDYKTSTTKTTTTTTAIVLWAHWAAFTSAYRVATDAVREDKHYRPMADPGGSIPRRTNHVNGQHIGCLQWLTDVVPVWYVCMWYLLLGGYGVAIRDVWLYHARHLNTIMHHSTSTRSSADADKPARRI